LATIHPSTSFSEDCGAERIVAECTLLATAQPASTQNRWQLRVTAGVALPQCLSRPTGQAIAVNPDPIPKFYGATARSGRCNVHQGTRGTRSSAAAGARYSPGPTRRTLGLCALCTIAPGSTRGQTPSESNQGAGESAGSGDDRRRQRLRIAQLVRGPRSPPIFSILQPHLTGRALAVASVLAAESPGGPTCSPQPTVAVRSQAATGLLYHMPRHFTRSWTIPRW
jgi:hypothetical protein